MAKSTRAVLQTLFAELEGQVKAASQETELMGMPDAKHETANAHDDSALVTSEGDRSAELDSEINEMHDNNTESRSHDDGSQGEMQPPGDQDPRAGEPKAPKVPDDPPVADELPSKAGSLEGIAASRKKLAHIASLGDQILRGVVSSAGQRQSGGSNSGRPAQKSAALAGEKAAKAASREVLAELKQRADLQVLNGIASVIMRGYEQAQKVAALLDRVKAAEDELLDAAELDGAPDEPPAESGPDGVSLEELQEIIMSLPPEAQAQLAEMLASSAGISPDEAGLDMGELMGDEEAPGDEEAMLEAALAAEGLPPEIAGEPEKMAKRRHSNWRPKSARDARLFNQIRKLIRNVSTNVE